MTVNTADLAHAAWRKSSRSNGQAHCVEVAVLGGDAVAVRDSKDTGGPALVFTPGAWRTFAARMKAGSDPA